MPYNQYKQRVSDPAGDRMVKVTESRHWFSPGRVISIVLGFVLAYIGTVALMRTGISNNLTTPQTRVFGMPQSAAIGIGELSAGLLLVVFGLWEGSQPVTAVLGMFGVIVGIMGSVASNQLKQDVGFGTDTARFIAVCGAVAIVAAMLPSVLKSSRAVREIDDRDRDDRDRDVREYDRDRDVREIDERNRTEIV